MKRQFIAVLIVCLLLVNACQAVPTTAPTAEPTAQPTQAASPSATRMQVALPVVSTVGEYQPESLCDHPYFPLRSGTKWTLTTSEVVMTIKVTALTNAAPEAVALVRRIFDYGERYDQAWRCTAEGIYGYDIAAFYQSSSSQPLPVTMLEHSGYYLPQVSLLNPGYTWDEHAVHINQGYTVTTDLHYEVLSHNPETVLGSVYPGLQVRVSGVMAAVDQDGKETKREVDFTRAFALGIGPVREDALELYRLTFAE